MLQRRFSKFVLGSLAAFAFILATNPGTAQAFGRRHKGGGCCGGGGGCYGGGYGGGCYGGGYGGGYHHGGRAAYDGGYAPTMIGYDGSEGGYYAQDGRYGMDRDTRSFYYSPQGTAGYYGQNSDMNFQQPNLIVEAPPDASIWISDTNMGNTRLFTLPKDTPSQGYAYDIKAKWRENGREVTRTKHINVRPNQRQILDFFAVAPSQNDQGTRPARFENGDTTPRSTNPNNNNNINTPNNNNNINTPKQDETTPAPKNKTTTPPRSEGSVP